MAEPLVVDIPHRLGKDEALTRIKSGFEQAGTAFGGMLLVLDQQWTGDHMDFKAGVLGQKASGGLDVFDDHVHLEIQLPWILATIANKAKAVLQKQTTLMLEKK